MTDVQLPPLPELGPDGKEWAKTEEGYAHVQRMLPRADGSHIGPFWYGWALREAFVAGAEWQEKRSVRAAVLMERERIAAMLDRSWLCDTVEEREHRAECAAAIRKGE